MSISEGACSASGLQSDGCEPPGRGRTQGRAPRGVGPRSREKAKLEKKELKARLVSPIDVARLLGLQPRRSGTSGALVLCPWHNERNPSCSLFVGRTGELRAHCHCCGNGGDVYALIAQVVGLDVRKDFGKVLREASTLATGVPEVAGDSPPRGTSPHHLHPKPRRRGLTPERYHALAWAWASLCAEFQDGSSGRAYLAERGLLEAADAAGLVVLPDGQVEVMSVIERLYRGGHESPAFSVHELDEAGVVQLGVRGGYSFRWPEHLVLIPWVDERGAITAIQQRHVGNVESEKKYIWPPGRAAHQPFGVEDLRDEKNVDVVIVEGALDTLARRQLARIHDEDIDVIGIASAGSAVAGLPLERLTGRRVVVAVDRDEAGDRAAAALHDALKTCAREIARVVPRARHAKDWGDQLQFEIRGE